mgnify:CR=1 FL=1
MISNKQFNSLVFTLIIISSIFYSPFIIYGVLHGIEAKIVPFFVSLIALYTQLILPPTLRFLLHLLDAKITYTPHNKDINGDN